MEFWFLLRVLAIGPLVWFPDPTGPETAVFCVIAAFMHVGRPLAVARATEKSGAVEAYFKRKWWLRRAQSILLSMIDFTIHHPYDGFFKHSLSNLTVAKDFLQAHLSPSIAQRIPRDSLPVA